ncbi:hypothetical protein [Candidatus Palauibacter sp.]|uniref:hypothetical protein n=1 Tax=Candidatus Palauibacter sp. TaxID=3101350 RepID=UPI003B026A48
MNSSNFPANPDIPVVADASVIINLNATASAAAIIGAFPNPFFVTPNVLRELSLGGSHGHRCGEELEALISQGSIALAELRSCDDVVYRSLVEGGFERTLDDGEAATIAYAVGHDSLALIDERKARRICAVRFPSLLFASTVAMLLHPLVAERLGEPGQSEAIFLALRDARMQVPRQRLREVIDRIGADRAAECPSLPRSFRDTHTDRAR